MLNTTISLPNCLKLNIFLTLSGDLFQTITLCPEFKRFLTIPDPILPKPMNPNFKLDGLTFFFNKV